MIKKKTFIFGKLNYLLLMIAVFQRIIGRKVYFLTVIKKWQNEKSIKFLESFGLKWLNYQDYEIEKGSQFLNDAVKLQKQFGNLIEYLFHT